MMAHHFQRDLLAGLGEFHALVGRVPHQLQFGQLLDHAGDAGGRDLQRGGDAGGGGRALALVEQVDGLQVVFNGRAEFFHLRST